jgi:hypothetical protein
MTILHSYLPKLYETINAKMSHIVVDAADFVAVFRAVLEGSAEIRPVLAGSPEMGLWMPKLLHSYGQDAIAQVQLSCILAL